MIKFLLLLLLVFGAYLMPFGFMYHAVNDGVYKNFPWSMEQSFIDNIGPWVLPIIPIVMFLVIHKALKPLLKVFFGGIPDHYTGSVEGELLSIDDYGARINGKSLKEARVRYLDREKLFSALPSDFISFFRSGNRVVVRYDPVNSDNSEIDIEASKLIDQSAAEAEADDLSLSQVASVDAYLKVTSIDFRPNAGAKAFEIKGVVQGSAHNGKEVTVFTDLEPSQVGSVTIGRLLPIVVPESPGDEQVKFLKGIF